MNSEDRSPYDKGELFGLEISRDPRVAESLAVEAPGHRESPRNTRTPSEHAPNVSARAARRPVRDSPFTLTHCNGLRAPYSRRAARAAASQSWLSVFCCVLSVTA